jgi:hypothetical protein
MTKEDAMCKAHYDLGQREERERIKALLDDLIKIHADKWMQSKGNATIVAVLAEFQEEIDSEGER